MMPRIQEKPRKSNPRVNAVVIIANDPAHPRVAKVLGKGPYRNSYGATCVAFVQAKGFPIQVGYAKNLPSRAKAAGFVVNGRVDEGAAFVTRESSANGYNTGHTGIILDTRDPAYVYVQEQNYRAGMLTEGWVLRAAIVAVVHR